MTEPIRIPYTVRTKTSEYIAGAAEITPEIHAQILAPLEKRIAALEACEQSRRSPLGQPSAEMQERMRQEIEAQPTAQGDEAAVVALTQLIVAETLPEKCDPAQIAFTYACAQKVATSALAAIRDGKVPGIGDRLFSGRLVPKLEADIARLKAELAASRTQVAALAGLLAEYRLCRGVVPSELLSRIDAALAAAGEGK